MVREGRIARKEKVVVLISGSGLKDPQSSRFLDNAEFPRIDSSLIEFEKTLSKTSAI
jgi:threonine synthase